MSVFSNNQLLNVNDVFGLQFQNLQQQLTDFGRVVAQQQQVIMQLLQNQQQPVNTVQWPSLPPPQAFQSQVNQQTSKPRKQKGTNPIPGAPPAKRNAQSNSRKRTPKNITLGNFLPNSIQKGSNKKKVHFTNKNSKQAAQKQKGDKKQKAIPQQQTKKAQTTTVKKVNPSQPLLPSSVNIELANRFLPLSSDLPEDDVIANLVEKQQRPANTTTAAATNPDTDAPVVTKVVPAQSKRNNKNKKKKKNNKIQDNLRITLTPGQSRIVTKVSEKNTNDSSNVKETSKIPRYFDRPHLKAQQIEHWLKNVAHVEAVQNDEVITASQGAASHVDRLVDFAAKTAFSYDQLTRALFEVQVWLFFLDLGTREHEPHWANEVTLAARSKEDARIRQFCEKRLLKINSDIERIRNEIAIISAQHDFKEQDGYEAIMFEYMNYALSKVRRHNELRMKTAKTERAESVAWDKFLTVANPAQVSLAQLVKAQLAKYRAKKIRHEERAVHATPEVDMLPKALPSLRLNFNLDKESMTEEDIKDVRKSMDDITREYRLKATELYIRSAKIELDYQATRITHLIEGSVLDPSQGQDNEANKLFEVFTKVHHCQTAAKAQKASLHLKDRFSKVEAPDPKDTEPMPIPKIDAPTVINQSTLTLTDAEYLILKKGPRFILNDPKRAAVRKIQELQQTYEKIRSHSSDRGWILPAAQLNTFIEALTIELDKIHEISKPSKDLKICRSLEKKLKDSNTILRKTDKSKVFHLGKADDYEEKAKQYMIKTKAYDCLGDNNPLQGLISETNSMLKGLLSGKHISFRLFRRLYVEESKAELAHLYFLPKAHKAGTPLRPIVAGLKSPTIEISRWLDSILRPLFDRLAKETSILNGVELIDLLERWSHQNLKSQTQFVTMDVSDLYTMVPQEGGIQAIKKMLRVFHIDQIQEVKTSTILLLARYVMKNNYFVYGNCYYKQIRGGAMGSPLTLTISNAYMYFFQTPIVKWVQHGNGIYCRYIDDIFIAANTTHELLEGLVQHWNRIDENIKLTADISQSVNFLDVAIANLNGVLQTSVFHKPSHEPYFLPYDSTHAMFIKRNIPKAAIIRAIRYSSELMEFSKEETHITVSLLLNGYPLRTIQRQYEIAFNEMKCAWPNIDNYREIRHIFLAHFFEKDNKIHEKEINFDIEMIFHFSYCHGMEKFAASFHEKWNEILGQFAITNIKPIVGFRNCESLQQKLVKKKPSKALITVQN
ncbi:unnamed protein product [Adineta ricciae]|uniref:Reverse transcriptase domain-containing protein n=1 Tax=Adineta ricciae TaxID=249248 RepID=A0A816CY26_ADIRI|nr:unnamed protein product [Adineta ricciae]CAF1630080.1 unnamed protein product [Adineta ricciae]